MSSPGFLSSTKVLQAFFFLLLLFYHQNWKSGNRSLWPNLCIQGRTLNFPKVRSFISWRARRSEPSLAISKFRCKTSDWIPQQLAKERRKSGNSNGWLAPSVLVMDKVQRKGDFKVSGIRGRVEWGCSDNQCHRLCFQRKQLWLPGFCWDFSWTGSQLGLVLFPTGQRVWTAWQEGSKKSNKSG